MEKELKEPIGRIMGHISQKVMSIIQEKLSHLEIERSFYPLLLIDEGKGQMSQNELSRLLHCDKTQVVRIIDYLSSIGYVNRVPAENDKRKHLLVITPKAEMQLPEIKETIYSINQIVLEKISGKQRAQLYNLLNKIDQNINKYVTE